MPQLLFATAMIGLMWLLLIRPQQQRVRAQQKLVASLQIGDEVVSAGGLFGRIVSQTEETDPPSVQLEISPGVVIRVATAALARPIGVSNVAETEGSDGPDDHDNR